MIELNVTTLANGALVERVAEEIKRVIANIADPNTPAKKPRTITMKMTIRPNEQRNMGEVQVATSSTICAPEPIETSIYIGSDPRTGELGASEMMPNENPLQNMLPEAEKLQRGKIVNFPSAQ